MDNGNWLKGWKDQRAILWVFVLSLFVFYFKQDCFLHSSSKNHTLPTYYMVLYNLTHMYCNFWLSKKIVIYLIWDTPMISRLCFYDFGLNQSIMIYFISKKRTFIPDRSVHSGDWNENKYIIYYSVICRSGFIISQFLATLFLQFSTHNHPNTLSGWDGTPYMYPK